MFRMRKRKKKKKDDFELDTMFEDFELEIDLPSC